MTILSRWKWRYVNFYQNVSKDLEAIEHVKSYLLPHVKQFMKLTNLNWNQIVSKI
jgi:hypothetical protein